MVFPQTYFETVGIDWLEPNAYGGAEPNSKTIEMPPGGERRQIQTTGWLVTYFAVVNDWLSETVRKIQINENKGLSNCLYT